jgi:hypothetical protein
MKDFMRDEPGAPAVVDRGTFQPNWTHCGLERRLTHEKATRLQPPAGGCPWSRWMARHHSSASVAH